MDAAAALTAAAASAHAHPRRPACHISIQPASRGHALLPQYLGDLGCEYVVFPNDAKTVDEIRAMNPRGILVSPGPGKGPLHGAGGRYGGRRGASGAGGRERRPPPRRAAAAAQASVGGRPLRMRCARPPALLMLYMGGVPLQAAPRTLVSL